MDGSRRRRRHRRHREGGEENPQESYDAKAFSNHEEAPPVLDFSEEEEPDLEAEE